MYQLQMCTENQPSNQSRNSPARSLEVQLLVYVPVVVRLHILRPEVSIPELSHARHDPVLIVEPRVHLAGDDLHVRVPHAQRVDPLGSRDDGDEHDPVLPDPSLDQPVDRGHGGHAGGEDGIEEQDVSIVDVGG